MNFLVKTGPLVQRRTGQHKISAMKITGLIAQLVRAYG